MIKDLEWLTKFSSFNPAYQKQNVLCFCNNYSQNNFQNWKGHVFCIVFFMLNQHMVFKTPHHIIFPTALKSYGLDHYNVSV